MTTVLWGASGVVQIDYLQNEKAISVEGYANLLDRFNEHLQPKQPPSNCALINYILRI